MSDGASMAKDSLSAVAANPARVDPSVATSHDGAVPPDPKRRLDAHDSSNARSESGSVYRVEPGDNLWTIAQRGPDDFSDAGPNEVRKCFSLSLSLFTFA